MTRKTWSTVDVSAYLDGELTPEVQVAFETTVSQDPDLQHRVAEMRQVVTLLRSVPLQEPPRNYILTSAMVTEAKPRTQRRRLPLLMMRIATSVAAVAFVVTSGLTLMQRGGTPAMMTQSQGAPEAATMPGKEAAWDEDEIEMLPAPVAEALPVEGFAEAKKEAPAAPEVEKAVVRAVEVEEVEEEVVSEAPAEPALGMQDTENIEEPGVSGGPEAPAPEGDTDSAKVTTEISDTADTMAAGVSVVSDEPTPQKGNVPAEVEPAPTEAAASEAVAEKEEEMAAEAPVPPLGAAGEMVTSDDSETAVRPMPEHDQALAMAGEAFEATEATPGSPSTASAVWTPIGLGVVTAMLAGITYWLSRRQLD